MVHVTLSVTQVQQLFKLLQQEVFTCVDIAGYSNNIDYATRQELLARARKYQDLEETLVNAILQKGESID